MEYIKLSKWESNIIQVGLDHIKDEFEFLTVEQYNLSHKIITNLSFYCSKSNQKFSDLVGFGLYPNEKILVSMAMTEIYIMHLDILISESDKEEVSFSQEVVKACKSIFNKLLNNNK